MKRWITDKKVCVIAFVILFAFLIVNLYLNQFSIASSDETYYYAMPFRLLQGDAMFQDTWEMHQTSAVLVMPIVYLYRLIVGDFTGLMLFMRVLFTMVQFGVTVCLFQMIRYRFHTISALIVALFYMNGVYLLIYAFSYNTMPMLFITLLISFIFSDKKSKFYTMKLYISGFFFALTVPAYPYFIFLFIAIGFLAMMILFINRRWYIDNKRYLVFFIVGMTTSTLLYLCYFLYNSSFTNLVHNFSNMQDPAHPNRGLWMPFKLYLKELFESVALMHGRKWMAVHTLCIGISFVLACVYQYAKSFKYRNILAICSLILICYVTIFQIRDILISYYPVQSQMDYLYIPFLIMLPTLWMLNLNKKNTIFAFTCASLGIIFSLFIQYGSNNQMQGSSFGFVLCAIPAICFFIEFILQAKSNKKLFLMSAMIISLCIGYHIIIVTKHRLTSSYSDVLIKNCTSYINVGPMKGLYTTKEAAKKEIGRYNFIKEHMCKQGYALFLDHYPSGYLIGELNVSAQSVWTSSSNIPVTQNYYKMHAEKLPNFLFIGDDEYFINKEIFDNLNKHGANIIKSEYGTIYVYDVKD